MQLKLSPLPKRPEDTVAPTSLNSEGEEQAHAEQKDAQPDEGPKEQPSATPKPAIRLPRDRYVAPEMANWTKVFRFGHTVLIPTTVNDSNVMLFGLDTGAFTNILSVRAGRQVSKVSSEERLHVRGLNGEVNKVYTSEKATLRFGHFQQTTIEMVTLDLSSLSRRMGTEISGFLGFAMLRALEIKVDYRDGLVDFVCDPKRRTALVQ